MILPRLVKQKYSI